MNRRIDGRTHNELRPIKLQPGFLHQPPGSVFIEWGATRVIIAVTMEDRVPPFLQGTGQGWVTAEYTILSRSGGSRVVRLNDRTGNTGRATEIRRFIGRSLRAAVHLNQLGERTLYVDCDVLEADGGTRVAAVTGGWVALALALERLNRDGRISTFPLARQLAAVSVGLIENETFLDLNYFEDSRADVDANIVMTAEGELVEFQMTGEHRVLPVKRLHPMLDLAWQGLQKILDLQRKTLKESLIPEHQNILNRSIPTHLSW